MTADVEFREAIVLTRSCDLDIRPEVRGKPEALAEKLQQQVLLAVVTRREQYTDPAALKKLANAFAGKMPRYHPVEPVEGQGNLNRGWSLVDFGSVFTLSLGYLAELAGGAGPRLRMVSPFRENLSHAFGRFFWRVALPGDPPPVR